MSPNSSTGVLGEEDADILTYKNIETKLPPRKYKFVWRNIILYIYLHISALLGVYFVFTSNWKSVIFNFIIGWFSLLGITAGVHRLWAHRSYKAKLPLRTFLLICQTIAFQGSVIEWSRDHRLHHKYSETDADPHNAKRGFFFSHVGWLLTRKHEEVKIKGKGVDMSDLYADPYLAFQHKHYLYLMPLMCFILPTTLPMLLWNECSLNSFFLNMLRYCLGLNITWLVNSAAHIYGHKPYDKYINPSENKGVSFFALGEGWHNYHHAFPWDYKTSEFGVKLNPTAVFINSMAKIGLAYELKSVAPEMIRNRALRTGDGTWKDIYEEKVKEIKKTEDAKSL